MILSESHPLSFAGKKVSITFGKAAVEFCRIGACLSCAPRAVPCTESRAGEDASQQRISALPAFLRPRIRLCSLASETSRSACAASRHVGATEQRPL